MTASMRGADTGGVAAAGRASVRPSPAELAATLGLPPPTPEQVAVITAPLDPIVVVAGAGSGKTETMAARVLWLVATGQVLPERVLGLTFTTKAAAELGDRFRSRLAGWAAAAAPDRGSPRIDVSGEPTVATYHSYAARVVAEHALRIAVEPSVRLLGEASTWQLASRVVMGWEGPLTGVNKQADYIINAVRSLAGDLADHLRTPADLVAWTASLIAGIEALPAACKPGRPSKPSKPLAPVQELLDTATARAQLAPLVEAYQQLKRSTGVLDFGDVTALAARIATEASQVGRIERSRYDVVLLDEFQDSSFAQVALMRGLFGEGHPVTAVGDPCQSIYGWRGASAGNLRRFAAAFPDSSGRPAAVLPLTTSFRNDLAVLDAANTVSAPLRAEGIDVGELKPRSAERAGETRVGFFSTDIEEVDWVADRIAAVWRSDGSVRDAGRGGRSIAILARRRAIFPTVAAALRERDIPFQLFGLGGLLATPEVSDVVATLRVLADPAAGDSLARLLTGARWRIGPRDLVALGRRARQLAGTAETAAGGHDAVAADHRAVDHAAASAGDFREVARTTTEGAVEAERHRARPDALDEPGLVEALDDLGPAATYSVAGYARLVALRDELRALRRRSNPGLPDLVAEVERTLGLDVESVVGPGRTRAHLDRFLDVTADFVREAEAASLPAFCAYLAAAEDEERGLDQAVIEPDGDRVQVLTVHAAKGLEWDVVAVLELSHTIFPTERGALGWVTGINALPVGLRGDAAELPTFDPASLTSQESARDRKRVLETEMKTRAVLEERRLAYVAVTRARHLLLAAGHQWDGDRKKPLPASPFLLDIRSAGAAIDHWQAEPPSGAANPLTTVDRRVPWPTDPLGARRACVQSGADLVTAAMHRTAGHSIGAGSMPDEHGSDESATNELFDPDAIGWAHEVDLLLAERSRPESETLDVRLPSQLSVSGLVGLRRDPASLARRIRRPVPTRPAPLARRGTAFHAWLEQRYGGSKLLDVDELPGAADETASGGTDLVSLQQAFGSSVWADRQPVEIEVPFETRLGVLALRGRMDAIFRDADGGFTVVDWKTGRRPIGLEAKAAAVQLAAYRLAWADLAGVPVEKVRAAFHYVLEGKTVAPVDLPGRDELVALITNLPTGATT